MIVLNLLEKASGVHSSQVLMFKSRMHLSYEFILANENTDNSMFCSLIKLQLHVLMATSGFPIFSLCRKKAGFSIIFSTDPDNYMFKYDRIAFFTALLRRWEFDSPCCTPETFLHIVRLLSSHTACYFEAVHQKQSTRPHSSYKLDKIRACFLQIKIMW